MAKITIVGETVVVTSNIKLDDYKTTAKYRPHRLMLKGEDGEPVFAVGLTGNPKGSINNVGAEFGAQSHDGTGRATITFDLPCGDGDVKERVAEKIGAAIIYLNKLEETIPEVVEEIAAEKIAVIESIFVQ